MTKFTIFGSPQSKANSRRLVYSKRNGRMISIKSKKALAYLDTFRDQCPKLKNLMEGDLRVDIYVYYESAQSDLDESIILDAMQDYIYKNDRQVKEKHVYHCGVEKQMPRAHIEVSHITKRKKFTDAD